MTVVVDANVLIAYGDPLADARPTLVREDERRWQWLVKLW